MTGPADQPPAAAGARPLRLAIYGKGGSGKSTIAANLSTLFARDGLRVLHVGCDPKHDSTWSLVPQAPIPTVIERFLADPGLSDPAAIVTVGRNGVHCVEAGGPQPGSGCGGRGVLVTSDLLRRLGLTRTEPAHLRYDAVLFDVVGDVVCGGFAGPVQLGLAHVVLVVVSGDVLSLYAGNNVARVVVPYAAAGVRLGGVVANLRDDETDLAVIEQFAARLGTTVIAALPRAPELRRAERARVPIVEHEPGAPYAVALRALAAAVRALDEGALPPPSPMDDAAFDAFVREAYR
jgi:nitrogenase iron protein NifH